jgi:type III restriction enzyme
LETLDGNGIIKRDNSFKDGGYEKLTALYPELLQTQIKQGKIVSPGGQKRRVIKLRQKNWEKIKDVWQELSKRYMLQFERLPDEETPALFKTVLETPGVFDENKDLMLTIQRTVKKDDGSIVLAEENITVENPGLIGILKYNDFVKILAKRTNIPIQIIHSKLWLCLKKFADNGAAKEEINRKLNQNSLEKIISLWVEKFAQTFAAKYDYNQLNFSAETSVIKNGSFVKELEAGLVGINPANDIADDDRNLYEQPTAYDSEPEHEVEKFKPNEKITVFGKIPRRAIKVPTYTGGSTTPDFIYYKETAGAAQASYNSKLTLLIEMKAKDLRGAEKRAVEAQAKLFNKIKSVKWELVKNADEIRAILQKL